MSPSAKLLTMAAGFTLLLLLSGAWLLQRQNSRNVDKAERSEVTNEEIETELRAARRSTRSSAKNQNRTQRASTADRDVTTGVKTVSVLSGHADVLPSLTGYIVDSFENWTTIPAGYRYHGIIVRDGAITLANDVDTSSSRFGELISPPLVLTAPAMAAPAATSRPIPAGSTLDMEISLSHDGETWTPWMATEKYSPPDGKRVVPTLQPSLSEREIKLHTAAKSTTSTATQGPSIRYRINLYANGPASPTVSDVRIWKREQ